MAALVSIKNLYVEYDSLAGKTKAVNGISFTINKGKAIGLVGETGAGKTTTALSMLRMVPSPPGHVYADEISFDGQDIQNLPLKLLQKIRGKQISMIFQDPMGSLNPIQTAGQQILEVIRIHQKLSKAEANKLAVSMLRQVGLTETIMDRYPHELSGGMKQRIMIAIALACKPKLLIADEPTTALDVTIQAQVMEIMKSIKAAYSGAILLITHDLGLVADICDEVAIMYAGQIVEHGTINEIFKNPLHPYTKGLFRSTPRLDVEQNALDPIQGLSPDPKNLPSGCFFHTRCVECMDICKDCTPTAFPISDSHTVSCWLKSERVVK